MENNDELVDHLKERGRIRTEEVEKAFRKVDRADFVPEQYRERAYWDRALPIGEESTISAPHMVAEATELLEVGKEDRVLEVGSGSGYQAAILSYIAKEVLGMEIKEELAQKSRKNLQGLENVEIINKGKLEEVEDLFDRILFSCAIESFEAAQRKLKDGGVIVAPIIEGEKQVMKRYRGGEIEDFFRVRYVRFQD